MNRQQLRQVPHYRVQSTPLARRTIRGAGVYALVQGVGIIIGGPGRWSSPSYALLKSVPGGPDAWGWLAVGIGVLILYGSRRRKWAVKSLGMFFLTIWHLAFAVGAAIAALAYPGAGTTAWPIYALVAYWSAVLIWVDEGNADAPQDGRQGRRMGRSTR